MIKLVNIKRKEWTGVTHRLIAIDLPRGYRVGAALPMVSFAPSATWRDRWFCIYRYFCAMREDDYWQLRVLWFCVGRKRHRVTYHPVNSEANQ